ncbi:MAG: hypothetical protein PHE88_09985 [Elusimicrobia bacterium]|nr:hypothetical protein [Elusimicrobiota bacterium]
MKSKNATIILVIGIIIFCIEVWQNSVASEALNYFNSNATWDDLKRCVDAGPYIYKQILQKHNMATFLIWIGAIGTGLGGYLLYKSSQEKISV